MYMCNLAYQNPIKWLSEAFFKNAAITKRQAPLQKEAHPKHSNILCQQIWNLNQKIVDKHCTLSNQVVIFCIQATHAIDVEIHKSQGPMYTCKSLYLCNKLSWMYCCAYAWKIAMYPCHMCFNLHHCIDEYETLSGCQSHCRHHKSDGTSITDPRNQQGNISYRILHYIPSTLVGHAKEVCHVVCNTPEWCLWCKREGLNTMRRNNWKYQNNPE